MSRALMAYMELGATVSTLINSQSTELTPSLPLSSKPEEREKGGEFGSRNGSLPLHVVRP
jgi:hypothetical protein